MKKINWSGLIKNRQKVFQFFSILFIVLISASSLYAQQRDFLEAELKTGEGAYSLLRRFGLPPSGEVVNRFMEINQITSLNLLKDKKYKLPIAIFTFDGKSIRTSIGNSDYAHALKIQQFNEHMFEQKVKRADFRKDKELWVPEFIDAASIPKTAQAENNIKGTFSIFGKAYEEVKLKSHELKGQVYYVVSGHGGPDPGAMATYNGHKVSEDEYAYDISLRLARNLLEHDATVYIITRDPNDGIRSEAYLKMDHDEVTYPNMTMPLNQVKRLNQRVGAINTLYKKHKKEGVKKQRVIIIHVDSRGKGQQLDMFFYYNAKSSSGKKLAYTMRNTIEKKYAEHQKSRGYSGTVKPRNLHMLRETWPVAVYIELGNIRNSRDIKRFIIEDNRQAVANWLCEGILNDN